MILINGCSFSRGPGSWPYQIAGLDQSNLVNLALAGSGNTYIYESTIEELSKRTYNAVIIMWTGIHRVDMRVSDIDYFQKSKYTSQYQVTQNDWAEKIIEPINDQDYVQRDWIFGCGHINNESVIRQTKAFEAIYKYQNIEIFARSFLIKLISLQNILKQMSIPYLFTFHDDVSSHMQIEQNLTKMIDFDHVFFTKNLRQVSNNLQSFDVDGIHPGLEAHKFWGKLIENVFFSKFIQETTHA